MILRRPRVLALILTTLVFSPAAHASTALDERHRIEAEALGARARALLAQHTVETRRSAIRALESAILLAPERADLRLQLARAYQEAGFLRMAMHRFEDVARLTPEDADARFGLDVWGRPRAAGVVQPDVPDPQVAPLAGRVAS